MHFPFLIHNHYSILVLFSLKKKTSTLEIIKVISIIIIITFFGCKASPDEEVSPYDFKSETNYLKGLELGAKLEKPLLLHFTGYACIGYNEFENDLITSKKIQDKLDKEFVTIQLYVDDGRKVSTTDTLGMYKTNLTEEGKERMRKARTIGDVNRIIETDLFKINSQPLYVITDSKGNVLVEPFGYTRSNRKYFLPKLNEGLRINSRKTRVR